MRSCLLAELSVTSSDCEVVDGWWGFKPCGEGKAETA